MKTYKSNKKLASIAILSLLIVIFFSAFHYHTNGKIEENCPLCRFQLYNHISDKGACQYFHIDRAQIVHTLITISETVIPTIDVLMPHYSHAPPVI
jgi:hypothetical protein